MAVAPQGYVVAGVLVSVIAVGIGWPWLGLRGVSAQATFERRNVTEGESVTLTLEIANRWPWPVWGLALQGFFSQPGEVASHNSAELTKFESAGALACVGGWTSAQFEFVVTPPVRGVYPVEPPRLATAFPFGVWTSCRPITIHRPLTVWPKRFVLGTRPLPAGKQSMSLFVSDHRHGELGEFTSVRPYRRGDLLRNIHWSHTARLDRFVVKERQDCAYGVARVQVCVDKLLLADRSPGGAWEWSLRLAASVAERLLDDHAQVEICVGQPLVTAQSGKPSKRRMFDELASVHPRIEGAVAIPANRKQMLWVCIGSAAMAQSFPAVTQANLQFLVDPAAWPDAWRQPIADLHRLPPPLQQQWDIAAANVWRGTEKAV
jgi:uncharacterized protein (DUF58 family)